MFFDRGPAAVLNSSLLPSQGKQCHERATSSTAPGSFCLEWPQADPPFATISSNLKDTLLVQWLVGQFRLADGRTAMLVANCNTNANFVLNFPFEMQRYWRIAPRKMMVSIETWPIILQFEVQNQDDRTC